MYASSRADEMAQLLDWTDEKKEAFLRFQFEAQDRHYREHYPDASYDVLALGDRDIGRLYVHRQPDEIRLMDIALLPEYRNQGIGRALVQELLDEAATGGRFVSLHVEEENPARRLYQRMGFVDAGELTFYKLMHWTAPEAKTGS